MVFECHSKTKPFAKCIWIPTVFVFSLFQTHSENLRLWDREREAELENQYKLFLKESKQKEFADVARQLAEKEEELFFFDNYDKHEKVKIDKFAEWRKTWPRRTWARQIKMDKVENHNKFKTAN